MNSEKNSFWENMWIFIIILLIIGFIYNIVEWIIKSIKNKDWISIVVWIIVTYILYSYLNTI
jgi:uncharacterized membrane protein YcjF (UPF0283 family)